MDESTLTNSENDSFYYGIYKTAKTKIDNCYGHSCY